MCLAAFMKVETFKNLVTTHLGCLRKFQLALFGLLRWLGLTGPLGLVRKVSSLPGSGETPASGPLLQNEFLKINQGHCFITSGYFEVAILDDAYGLIPELSPDTYVPLEHRALRQMPLRRQKTRGLCVLVTPGARDNYYHWMVDLMPAFRQLVAGNDPELLGATVLLNHSGRPYQLDSLKALDLGVEVVNARTYTMYDSECLYVRRSPATPFSVQDAVFLRNLFSAQADAVPVDLYVVRGQTRRRRIRNESEVIALMQKRGFMICDPAKLSVHQQARLFACARTVVGFHGAGLTNSLFCEAGTKLVELFDCGYVADYYSRIAHQLNLQYYNLACNTSAKPVRSGIAEDIGVDVGALEDKLKCVI